VDIIVGDLDMVDTVDTEDMDVEGDTDRSGGDISDVDIYIQYSLDVEDIITHEEDTITKLS
jgi:hypothetical protein